MSTKKPPQWEARIGAANRAHAEMSRFTCQVLLVSYINLKGAAASNDNRALGQSPETVNLGLCPGMEVLVPVGARLFNQTINNSHDHPGHNSGQDVKQELLHKATSFTEDCPANLIAHCPAHDNARMAGFLRSGAKNTRARPDGWIKNPAKTARRRV